MRCKNCHTVMMETDLECPSCHASVASATAAPPGPINKPHNLAILLPVFGGAIGGAIYGAMAAANNTTPSRGVRGPSGTGSGGTAKWIFGLLFILGGGLVLLLATVQFLQTWKIAHREPKAVSATELRQTKNSKSSPGPWLAYDFTESKPTDFTVTRRRLSHGGDVKARCLLVRVEDKWLVASVAKGFEGNRLVGRLVSNDSPSAQILFDKVHKIQSKSSLLPFEFNAVDGSASDQEARYLACAWLGGFGLVGLLLGLFLIRPERQVVTSEAAAPAKIGSFLPQASR